MANACQKFNLAVAFDNETVLTRLILKAFIETLAMRGPSQQILAQSGKQIKIDPLKLV